MLTEFEMPFLYHDDFVMRKNHLNQCYEKTDVVYFKFSLKK